MSRVRVSSSAPLPSLTEVPTTLAEALETTAPTLVEVAEALAEALETTGTHLRTAPHAG